MQTSEPTGLKSIEWAAGLFEGEGTLYRRKNGRWHIRIKMTDLDVLEDFLGVIDAGHLTGPYHPPSLKAHHKPFWHWEAGRRDDLLRVVQKLLPYLGHRRSQLARNCLQEYGTNLCY